MTRDEAVVLIQQQLGFRRDLQTAIITNLQAAQVMLEKGPTKPWFLLSEDSTIRTTIGERRVRVPTDFLAEYELGSLEFVPDDPLRDAVDLVKESREQLKRIYTEQKVGEPEAYSTDGYYFSLWPKPDEQYLLRMRYYRRAQVLTTNVENSWLREVPLLLAGEAGLLTAAAVRDQAASQQFQTWVARGRLMLDGHNEELKHTNRTYQIGGTH